MELLTGKVKGKTRQSVLQGLIDGGVGILVGTHAVIEENVRFARHRAGVTVVTGYEQVDVEVVVGGLVMNEATKGRGTLNGTS